MKKITLILLTIILCFSLSACGVGKEGISLKEYEQLEVGMTMSEIEKIVGGSGTLLDEQTFRGELYYITRTYEFKGEITGTCTLHMISNAKNEDEPVFTLETKQERGVI